MSSAKSTNDSDSDSSDSSNSVCASGSIKREDWDMIGRITRTLSNDTRVRVDHDGIHVEIVDAANVAMLDLHVVPEQWSCEQTGTIAINVESGITDPMKALKSMGKDVVEIDINDDRIDYEMMYVETIDVDGIRRMPDVPDISFDAHATIPLIDIKEWMNAVSDYRNITIEQDGTDCIISCNDATTEMSKTFHNVCESPGDSKSTMCTNYIYGLMNQILKGHAKMFDASMAWDDEYPLEICLKSREDAETDIKGKYVQAPRIKDD